MPTIKIINGRKHVVPDAGTWIEIEIEYAVALPDFTIIAMFKDKSKRMYDIRPLFNNEKFSSFFTGIKSNPQKFVKDFQFNPYGVRWAGEIDSDVAEYELYVNGKIIQ